MTQTFNLLIVNHNDKSLYNSVWWSRFYLLSEYPMVGDLQCSDYWKIHL